MEDCFVEPNCVVLVAVDDDLPVVVCRPVVVIILLGAVLVRPVVSMLSQLVPLVQPGHSHL